MIIRIGCVDGHTYTSDRTPDSEIQKYIDERDGYIGTGDYVDQRAATVNDAAGMILKLLKHDTRNNYQTVNFKVNGRERYFNVSHVVWYEIHFDEEAGTQWD